MRCRFWIETKKSFRIKYDVNEKAKKNLDTAGINIPFPQQDRRTEKSRIIEKQLNIHKK